MTRRGMAAALIVVGAATVFLSLMDFNPASFYLVFVDGQLVSGRTSDPVRAQVVASLGATALLGGLLLIAVARWPKFAAWFVYWFKVGIALFGVALIVYYLPDYDRRSYSSDARLGVSAGAVLVVVGALSAYRHGRGST